MKSKESAPGHVKAVAPAVCVGGVAVDKLPAIEGQRTGCDSERKPRVCTSCAAVDHRHHPSQPPAHPVIPRSCALENTRDIMWYSSESYTVTEVAKSASADRFSCSVAPPEAAVPSGPAASASDTGVVAVRCADNCIPRVIFWVTRFHRVKIQPEHQRTTSSIRQTGFEKLDPWPYTLGPSNPSCGRKLFSSKWKRKPMSVASTGSLNHDSEEPAPSIPYISAKWCLPHPD